MPIYDYECQECSHTTQVKATMQEKEKGLSVECDGCGSASVQQVFRAMAFVGGKESERMGPCGDHCACFN